jgi:hypothetical protein
MRDIVLDLETCVSANHRDVGFEVLVPPPVAHENLVRNEKENAVPGQFEMTN